MTATAIPKRLSMFGLQDDHDRNPEELVDVRLQLVVDWDRRVVLLRGGHEGLAFKVQR